MAICYFIAIKNPGTPFWTLLDSNQYTIPEERFPGNGKPGDAPSLQCIQLKVNRTVKVIQARVVDALAYIPVEQLLFGRCGITTANQGTLLLLTTDHRIMRATKAGLIAFGCYLAAHVLSSQLLWELGTLLYVLMFLLLLGAFDFKE